MHEMSIMQSVFDAAFAALERAGETRITDIKLTIGELTEIQEIPLNFAFEALKPNTPARNAKLSVTMLTPRSRCGDCDAEFDHDRFTMMCPNCDSINLTLLQGRELQIDALEADSEPFVESDPDFDPFAQFLPDPVCHPEQFEAPGKQSSGLFSAEKRFASAKRVVEGSCPADNCPSSKE